MSLSSFLRLKPVLVAFLALGCGRSYMPPQYSESASPLSFGQYPLRTDLMVVGKTGLDGAPKHWPSPGFPPLLSAQFPRSTPDADIANDIRQRLGKAVLDPSADLNTAQAQILAKLLEDSFGIPAGPRVSVPDWDAVAISAVARPDFSKGAFANMASYAAAKSSWEEAKRWERVWLSANDARNILDLDEQSLARGSVIYRRLCLQCHGLTGAGDGAQAIALAAMPRDYRQGIFKFITAFPTPGPEKRLLNPGGKPRREDLKRTIHHGLDGSMMPAFSNIPDQDLDDLVSYVIHLSIRGETEFATMARAMQPTQDDPDFVGPELKWLYMQNYLSVLDNWGLAARSAIPIPPEYAATNDERLLSAIRGYKFYNSAEFGCGACHINFGREPALKWDLWGTVVQPRNLMLGVYRGGRRGQDLYARIYGGIYPSGMNAFHDKLKTGPSYPDQPNKIWNIVHFLEALADPAARQSIKDPAALARFKEQLKAEGDLFLEDLSAVKIDP